MAEYTNLHSYAVPDDFEEAKVTRPIFRGILFVYWPELKSAKILNENLQVKKDFTAFHTGLYKNRMEPITKVNNFYLTGDWIKLPIPAMLMEASASSALYAVNDIFEKESITD